MTISNWLSDEHFTDNSEKNVIAQHYNKTFKKGKDD